MSSAAEASNLAFNSTLVVAGEAWGVVVRTGDHTFIGQIASLTGGETGNKSPLAQEIDAFVRVISGIASVVSLPHPRRNEISDKINVQPTASLPPFCFSSSVSPRYTREKLLLPSVAPFSSFRDRD